MAKSAATALRGRVIAVLNLGSGSSDAGSPAKMEAIFREAGLTSIQVIAVEPANLELALDDAALRGDVVVVLGGDGTIRSAAVKCGAAGKFLMPLPGGTMNMLPRALYGLRSWEQALCDTLADPRARSVSGGVAEGEHFFCAAILGAPTLWADAREALRGGDIVEGLKRSITAIRRSRDEPLRFQFGDQVKGEGGAVAVICPLVARGLASQTPALEAAAIERHTGAAFFQFAFHAIFDDWRLDQSVQRAEVLQVRVTGHGPVPVILDGEKVRMGRRVNITFAPNVFRAINPGEQTVGAVSSI